MAYEILIIDDEADIRMLTGGILEDEGYQTREAADSDAALAAIEARSPSLVLLDIWLQGSRMDGLGILESIKKDYPNLPVIMMSGHGTIETAVSALKLGAYDFIQKPFKADRMLVLIERAIEAERLKRENEELRLRSGTNMDLIGTSQTISTVKQSIEKVAPTNSRVLISGSPGSGKEMVARLIHKKSKRATGPFVSLNCVLLEPDMVERKLFGIANSETGDGKRVGLLEQAHNGTLFLDEIADMPLETQGKMVRALQEQTYFRVGGKTKVEVDVRVVSATTKNLKEEISAGRFREDLFYRLSVVPVEIPSLRERREDIPELARFFMGVSAKAIGQQERIFSEDAYVTLQTYDWPGNVRELRNIIERLLILAPGNPSEPIKADILASELNSTSNGTSKIDKSSEIMGLPLRQAREIFEREYLIGQVERFGGNISKTAEFVGMERSALHRKLKSLGVNSDPKVKDDE
ncbi:MAG: sigma-54 dependent transcriptional regulator [Alphaproteobacteria bacterium]|nr:sigma-54 dependent transcriptional regulator [Rhodospirillales bacterium]MCW9046037.1 sigma-54 dependent transcriptional regulator [Alphaproteobacteria bacterium]